MRALFILSLFLFNSYLVVAQDTDSKPATRAIYAELGGVGLPYSFNYDFRFDKNRVDSWGMRVGFGGYSLEGDSFFSLPVMINKLYGKGNNFFEVGVGTTFIAFSNENYTNCYYDQFGNYTCTTSSNESTNFILDIDGSPSVMGVLNFGYRRMPTDGGFMWKINLNPIFNNNGFWPLFAGVGFGYAF
ncbi:hypothetical protein [Algoriphagus sp. NG3]|uniref:hypothetical protein n=1 Tax=Algoriphagus sp. NG3 TaxID=3097546 RepID=UPI002A80149F|nr:hypothetical protein [Algoriphagus sp. NG3]WPR77170.1 hypothetical protein SLW71_07420 [Algoriphagus sp. NG3]